MEDNQTSPRYVPTDKRGWIRDTKTGALLSVDRTAQKEHNQRVSTERIKTEELNSLKDEVSQLKELVNKLIGDK
jgi:hypothetical protein